MNLYDEIQQLISVQFPEHREDYRVNLLSEMMVNKIRNIATDFAQSLEIENGENISEQFKIYLEQYRSRY